MASSIFYHPCEVDNTPELRKINYCSTWQIISWRILHRRVDMISSWYVPLRNISTCGPQKPFIYRILSPKTCFQGATGSSYLINIFFPVGSLLYVTKGHISHQNKENYTHQAIKLANEARRLEEVEPAMIKIESEYLTK